MLPNISSKIMCLFHKPLIVEAHANIPQVLTTIYKIKKINVKSFENIDPNSKLLLYCMYDLRTSNLVRTSSRNDDSFSSVLLKSPRFNI